MLSPAQGWGLGAPKDAKAGQKPGFPTAAGPRRPPRHPHPSCRGRLSLMHLARGGGRRECKHPSQNRQLRSPQRRTL